MTVSQPLCISKAPVRALPAISSGTHTPTVQNGQFDAIVFNASFHYSEDYDATLSEAFRCLRSGGIVIISDTPWYSGRRAAGEWSPSATPPFSKVMDRFDSIRSLEFLTDKRLRALEEHLSIKWTVHSPRYGFKWQCAVDSATASQARTLPVSHLHSEERCMTPVAFRGTADRTVIQGARCALGPRESARASIHIAAGRVTHIAREPYFHHRQIRMYRD